MERQQIDDELSRTGAQELLGPPRPPPRLHRKDETPRVVPVGFFWTGNQFDISTATTSPKVKALSARPAVALAIDAGDYSNQARALSIRGRRASRSSTAWSRSTSPLPESHGRRSSGRVRAETSAGCTTRCSNCDHAALGALLRLRRWPNAAILQDLAERNQS